MSHESTQIICFPPFRLDLDNEQLWKDEQLIALRPKTLAVLRYLIEHAGRLITKEELLRSVWGNTRVSATLPKDYIQELRKALHDAPKAPQFIETVHGRGYRFIAPLRPAPLVQSSTPELQGLASHTQNSTFRIQHALASVPHLQSTTLPLVGREAELAQLHECLEKARRGARQVVFITGEPGIGKTALVKTFVRQALANGLRVAQGQCLEHYGAGEAYMPMLEALGHLCRDENNGAVLPILTRYAPSWLVQMPSIISPADLEVLQRRIQGVTRERMLREMAEAVETLTAAQPLILVLEDLHWSDYSTLDLITLLAQREPPAQLFVIGSYRPTDVRIKNHPLNVVKQELQLHGRCQELSLPFLQETEVAAYLTARFARHHFPPLLSRAIYKRTEGNPLFMVHMVEYLTSQGLIAQHQGAWTVRGSIEEIERSAPESLRQTIEKQLDELQPGERSLLEAASVVGAEFTAAAVAGGLQEEKETIEEQCAELARKGLLIQFHEYQEWPDGSITGRYSFIHALYQEALYNRITPGRRMRLHRKIGERLEAGYQGQHGTIASALALHFERSREYSRTVRYLHVAGETALRRCAYQEAIAHCTKALELLKLLPDSPERLQQELRLLITLGAPLIATAGYASPQVEQTYGRARELCRQAGEAPELFPVLWGLWVMYFVRGNLHTAQESAEQLLHLAQEARDPALLLEACVAMGLTEILLGNFATALDHLERGIALYDIAQHGSHTFVYGQDPGMACLSWAAWALWVLGCPDRARQRSREAIDLARRLTSPFNLSYALGCAAVLHQFRQEAQETEICARENIDLAAAQGFTLWRAAAHILLGWALAAQHRFDDGLTELYAGLTSWQATGAGFLQSYGFALLPEVYQETGQIDEGLAALSGAFTIVEQNGERLWEAELHRLYGEFLLRKSDTDRGKQGEGMSSSPSSDLTLPQASPEECFLKAIAVSRKQQAKSLELRAVMSLARLWRRQGKHAEARRKLKKVYERFTEGFDTADLQAARQLLEELA
jgi:DNA-binding winged helix-turn-helix (wHTH) protein/predicted ATPase